MLGGVAGVGIGKVLAWTSATTKVRWRTWTSLACSGRERRVVWVMVIGLLLMVLGTGCAID